MYVSVASEAARARQPSRRPPRARRAAAHALPHSHALTPTYRTPAAPYCVGAPHATPTRERALGARRPTIYMSCVASRSSPRTHRQQQQSMSCTRRTCMCGALVCSFIRTGLLFAASIRASSAHRAAMAPQRARARAASRCACARTAASAGSRRRRRGRRRDRGRWSAASRRRRVQRGRRRRRSARCRHAT